MDKKKNKKDNQEIKFGLSMGANISMSSGYALRLEIKEPPLSTFEKLFGKIPEFGEFTIYNESRKAHEYFCDDCKEYKLGNILMDSETRKLIFICGDCFEKRIEKIKGSE